MHILLTTTRLVVLAIVKDFHLNLRGNLYGISLFNALQEHPHFVFTVDATYP